MFGSTFGGTAAWPQGVAADRRGRVQVLHVTACGGSGRREAGPSERWEPLSCKGREALAPLRPAVRSERFPCRRSGAVNGLNIPVRQTGCTDVRDPFVEFETVAGPAVCCTTHRWS